MQSFSHTKSSSASGSFFGSSSKDKKKKDKRKKSKPFNLEAEKEQMKSVIAESSIATTNLLNTLQSINREQERISENAQAVQRFEACKLLRRKILRYVSRNSHAKSHALHALTSLKIHLVEDEQWLGSLLKANDDLVNSLMTFEQLDRSIDADSDSDDELAEQAHAYRSEVPCTFVPFDTRLTWHQVATMNKGKDPASPSSPTRDLAGLTISSPSRPSPPPRPSPLSKPAAPRSLPPQQATDDDEDSYQDEDENDPFADRNAVTTPGVEKSNPRWGPN